MGWKYVFPVFCLFTSTAAAETITVGDSLEFRAALERVGAGDEVTLLPGRYQIGRFNTSTGGRPGQPIIVKALVAGSAIIHVRDTETFSITHPYWFFENLTIQGTDKTHHAFHLAGNADNVRIRNCRLTNFHSHIKSNGNGHQFPDRVLIEGNRLHNDVLRNTSEPTTPIDAVGGRNWVIRNNFIADFGKNGRNAVSYGAFLKGNSRQGLIEQNLVICSWKHQGGYRIGLSLGGGGTEASYCENQDCRVEHRNGTIRNNIVLNCSDAGIFIKKAEQSGVYHNTLIDTLGIDIQVYPGSAVVENNYVGGVVLVRKGATAIASGNITTSWGWFPHAEVVADRLNYRISDYDVRFPSIFNRQRLELLKSWITGVATYVADSRLGLGRDVARSFFNGLAFGDLRPGRPSVLEARWSVPSVQRDFWGNDRNTERTYIGAIDLSVSSCDISTIIRSGDGSRGGACLNN